LLPEILKGFKSFLEQVIPAAKNKMRSSKEHAT